MASKISELMAQLIGATETAEVEHYCDGGCGTVVQSMRQRCPSCVERAKQHDRRLVLSVAYSSLPQMPWAEFGGDFEKNCNAKILSASARWARLKGNLLLLGPTGCGKTSAVVARMRAILARAVKGVDRQSFEFAAGIRFTTAGDLALARKRWPLGDGEAPEVEDAMNATLLALDELGFEQQTDTAVPDVIDYRYRHGRLTLATSGLTRDALVARYGDATTRKLIASGEIADAHVAQ